METRRSASGRLVHVRSSFAKVGIIATAQAAQRACYFAAANWHHPDPEINAHIHADCPWMGAALAWLFEAPAPVQCYLAAVAQLDKPHRPYLVKLWAMLLCNGAAYDWIGPHGEAWLKRAPKRRKLQQRGLSRLGAVADAELILQGE